MKTIERYGRTYEKVSSTGDVLVYAQGPGYRSRQHVVKCDEVGAIASRLVGCKHADLLIVSSMDWNSSSGYLTLSSYRLVNGEWRHVNGKRITSVDEIV